MSVASKNTYIWTSSSTAFQRPPGEVTRVIMEDIKYLAVSKQEAELIMDSFKVSNPLTRNIALKAAGLVLEFASSDGIKEAERLTIVKSDGRSVQSSDGRTVQSAELEA